MMPRTLTRQEDFVRAAERYVEARRSLEESRKSADKAKRAQEIASAKLEAISKELGEFVGCNESRRCAVCSGGTVVTIVYLDEAKRSITTYGSEGGPI